MLPQILPNISLLLLRICMLVLRKYRMGYYICMKPDNCQILMGVHVRQFVEQALEDCQHD
jgi:hypothetical protein